MRSVRLNFLFIFFLFGLLHQGYADNCPSLVWTNTHAGANLSKAGKGIKNFFLGKWSDLDFNEKLLQYIKVRAIKDQGIDGYFNPKIRVCDYEGDNCHELYSGTFCQKIYGTQWNGTGVSAAVFIDWEGDITKVGGEIAQSLEWEWADGVSDEEKVKFINSPKICACSQKSACLSGGVSATFASWNQGVNTFYPGEIVKVCDICSWSAGKQKVKCAPVPLASSPPPFCEQLAVSLPQVKIVPITNEKNDYFDPKVRVIIGHLIGKDGEVGEELNFPRKYKRDKIGESSSSDEVKEHSILDRDGTIYYFETYRKKNKLCTEYFGTEKEKSKRRLQFPTRCFPAPPAPEPKIVEVVNENTLKIEIKMSRENCMKQINGSYSDGYCTFNISFYSSEDRKKNDLRFFRVIKPTIVKKIINNNNDESNIVDVIEDVLKKNPQFVIFRKYGLTPDIGIQFSDGKSYSLINFKEDNEIKSIKLKLDDMGLPKVKVTYMRVNNGQKSSKRKMLCLSGWKPEPEEFILKRENELIRLKSMGVGYIKYNAVYSRESNQFYYLPSSEIKKVGEIYVDILAKPQDMLNDIVFDKQGYVFFSDENKQEIGKCSYCVNENSKVNEAFQSGKGLKVVYKLIDGEYKEKCEQDQDGCLCFDEICSRSTRYLNKKNDEPFYLRYEKVDCKDKNGRILKNERGEVQKCMQLKDQIIKARKTEVFYADKLCRIDLKGLKLKLKEIIKKQLEKKKQEIEDKSNKRTYHLDDGGYTDDLSQYDYVEIEAYGAGEAGHIKNTAHSIESRTGMPGDYIKAKLKIDHNYPVIRVKVTEGGGVKEDSLSNKDGGPTWIEICDSRRQYCKSLITIAGGGVNKLYDDKKYSTQIHIDNLSSKEDLKLEKLIVTDKTSIDDQIAYIKDGEIKYEVIECKSGLRSSKPGAGGCINKNKGIYGNGSSGHVKIKPVFDKIDENKIKKIDSTIEGIVQNFNSLESIDDSWISKLDSNIIGIIKEEIRKEFLEISIQERSGLKNDR